MCVCVFVCVCVCFNQNVSRGIIVLKFRHELRRDEANTTSISPSRRNSYHYNEALQKHVSNDLHA